jgi:hypothetical protein
MLDDWEPPRTKEEYRMLLRVFATILVTWGAPDLDAILKVIMANYPLLPSVGMSRDEVRIALQEAIDAEVAESAKVKSVNPWDEPLAEFHRRHPDPKAELPPDELRDLLALLAGRMSCDHGETIPEQTVDSVNAVKDRYRPAQKPRLVDD